MTTAAEHLEALRRNSAELSDAIAAGDLGALASLIEARNASVEFLLARADALDERDRELLQSTLQAHDSTVHQMRGIRDRISDEIATIRHGRSVARSNRASTGPVRFVSERC